MTKEQLKNIVEDQEDKIGELENDVEYWKREYVELEEQYDQLEKELDDEEYEIRIKNKDNFIFKLKTEELYDEKIIKFIEDYLNYWNY